jgi:hypothetical protein
VTIGWGLETVSGLRHFEFTLKTAYLVFISLFYYRGKGGRVNTRYTVCRIFSVMLEKTLNIICNLGNVLIAYTRNVCSITSISNYDSLIESRHRPILLFEKPETKNRKSFTFI